MTALEPARAAHLARLEELAEQTAAYADASLAPGTRAAYEFAWADWSQWAAEHGASILPADPKAFAMFLTERSASMGISALRKRVAAVTREHNRAGIDTSPSKSRLVQDTMRGITRDIGPARPVTKANPALMKDVAAMLRHLPDGIRGVRDRAVLLVGFAGARRRSEISGLNLDDVRDTDDGLKVRLRRSKTDQTGEAGELLGLPYSPNPDTCPVRAWRAWRAVLVQADALEAADSAAFRVVNARGQLRPAERMSGQAVARMVHRYALAAGLSAGRWSGHSLRAGLATDAARQGVQERVIAKQTGHKNMDVLRGYIRDGDLFRENAAAAVLR